MTIPQPSQPVCDPIKSAHVSGHKWYWFHRRARSTPCPVPVGLPDCNQRSPQSHTRAERSHIPAPPQGEAHPHPSKPPANLRGCARCVALRAPCERRERRLTGRALAVGVRKYLGGLRCLTLRYSLPLSVWFDPNAEHTLPSYAARGPGGHPSGWLVGLQPKVPTKPQTSGEKPHPSIGGSTPPPQQTSEAVLGVWRSAPLRTSRALPYRARFGRWHQERFGRASMFDLAV